VPAFVSRPVLSLAALLALVALIGGVKIAADSGSVDAAESPAGSEYTFGADVPAASQDEIRHAVEATRGWLRTEAGLELPAVHVVASADRQMLLRHYGRGGPVPDRDQPLLDQWLGSGGAITSGLDVFLYTNERWNGLDRSEREFIVAHEVFHTLEYRDAARMGETIPGPIWLVEGAAEYVAARVVAAQGNAGFESYLADYRERAKGLTQSLRDLESYGRGGVAWGRRPQYTLGFLAADRLVTQSGLADFLGVWRVMGAGASFEAAFAAQFGESPARFSASFDKDRGSH
jgi:hypothetical protein